MRRVKIRRCIYISLTRFSSTSVRFPMATIFHRHGKLFQETKVTFSWDESHIFNTCEEWESTLGIYGSKQPKTGQGRGYWLPEGFRD